MRSALIVFIVGLTFNTSAQTRGTVRIQNDTIFNKNVPSFIIKTEAKANQSLYFIADMNKKPQAAIFFSEQDTQIRCTARFPGLSLRYDVVYPKIDISVLIESYFKNKVFVNGKVDSLGLLKYCKEREIALAPMTNRRQNQPANDSIMAEVARGDYASQVAFSLENNSAQQFKVRIGKTGLNRTIILDSNRTIVEHTHVGDQVCIIENNDKIRSCFEIKKETNKIIVNKDGTVVSQ